MRVDWRHFQIMERWKKYTLFFFLGRYKEKYLSMREQIYVMREKVIEIKDEWKDFTGKIKPLLPGLNSSKIKFFQARLEEEDRGCSGVTWRLQEGVYERGTIGAFRKTIHRDFTYPFKHLREKIVIKHLKK